MYIDSKNDRVLLRDGRSVVSSLKYTKMLINGEDVRGICVQEDRDSLLYDYINGTNLSCIPEEVNPTPPERPVYDKGEILSLLKEFPRYEDTEKVNNRLELELDFFDRTGNIEFILKLIDLIERFKEDGVVWGVGRGSSCASYIMYLIEVNDINPLVFDIPFNEMSKEF